jgi:hypothetical protein
MAVIFCVLCRYYCPKNDSSGYYPQFGVYECPVGFYCPKGTGSADMKPCPVGTYNPRTRTFKV